MSAQEQKQFDSKTTNEASQRPGPGLLVGRIDVFELDRPLPIENDCGFLRCGEREVVHIGGHEGETTWSEGLVASTGLGELLAHSKGERAGNYDDIFIGRMRMRGMA